MTGKGEWRHNGPTITAAGERETVGKRYRERGKAGDKGKVTRKGEKTGKGDGKGEKTG